MIMLDGPPAAAIRYVKESNGLDPSLYGGGGSLSSDFFPEVSSFVSCERVAFVSETMANESSDEDD